MKMEQMAGDPSRASLSSRSGSILGALGGGGAANKGNTVVGVGHDGRLLRNHSTEHGIEHHHEEDSDFEDEFELF